MRIIKGSITDLARAGHPTIQIPELAIGDVEYEEVPDEWICRLSNYEPCTTSRGGLPYLTRAGFEANKEKLKQAFELAIKEGKDRTHGKGWELFEDKVEIHFKNVETKIIKRLIALKDKIDFLINFKI